jgi:putative transposase
MARPLRVLLSNGVYHLTARGIAKQSIYVDDVDRRRFLRGLERAVSRFGWRCLAYCLMDNHFHLVDLTPGQ